MDEKQKLAAELKALLEEKKAQNEALKNFILALETKVASPDKKKKM